MAFPYSTGGDDEAGMPVGAIRSMLRLPISDPVPMAIPRRSAVAAMPTPAQAPQPAPELDLPPIKWGNSQNEWAGLAGSLVNTLRKFEPPEEILNMDKALADLKGRKVPVHEAWQARQTPATGDDAAPPSGSYRANARRIESGGNDDAVNKASGATGRYQFLPSTAKELIDANPHLGLRIEDLKNPDVQEKLMTLYTDKSVKTLKPLLGRDPTPGELYLTHLLGHSGGPAVLSNLDAPISETIDRRAYDANKSLLSPHRTGRQLVAYFNKRLGG